MNESIVIAIIALMEKLESLPLGYGKASKTARTLMDEQSTKCRNALMRLNATYPAEYKVAYIEYNEDAIWRNFIRMSKD